MTLREAQKKLRDLLARMSVLSEVSAVNYDPNPVAHTKGDHSMGGNRPSGGVDRKADREPEFFLKSHDHFVRRAQRCRSLSDYLSVIADAERCIEAWTNPPIQEEPKPGEPFFRRYVEQTIAKNPGASDERIAILCGGVSRRRVNQIRREAA